MARDKNVLPTGMTRTVKALEDGVIRQALTGEGGQPKVLGKPLGHVRPAPFVTDRWPLRVAVYKCERNRCAGFDPSGGGGRPSRIGPQLKRAGRNPRPLLYANFTVRSPRCQLSGIRSCSCSYARQSRSQLACHS